MIEHAIQFDRRIVNVSFADGIAAPVVFNELAVHEAAPTDEVLTEQIVEPSENMDAHRDALLDRVVGAIDEVRSRANEAVDQWQALAVRFAGIMVQQLVGESDAMQSGRLKKLVSELVQLPEVPLRIAAHPDDRSLVQSCLDTRADLAGKIELVADPAIALGECRAIYSDHELVSQLESQLPDIEYRLLEAFRND